MGLRADLSAYPEVLLPALQVLGVPAHRALRPSPAARDLSGLAPTVVLTAEHDVLRAEGDPVADRLRESLGTTRETSG